MDPASSRPLGDLNCPTLHFLTAFLLSDTDLMAIGCWDPGTRRGLTPAAWCRSLLHVAIRRDGDAGRGVADLLDLRYAGEVLHVRATDPALLASEAACAVEADVRQRGLVWALVTDSRPEVQALGETLITEICVRACRDWGAGAAARS